MQEYKATVLELLENTAQSAVCCVECKA